MPPVAVLLAALFGVLPFWTAPTVVLRVLLLLVCDMCVALGLCCGLVLRWVLPEPVETFPPAP